MTDEYSFDGWGKLTSSTGSTANSQLYKGEYLAYCKDPDAGPELQYSTHHRNYNPQTGVFTAADPAKDDLNLYRYVKNNPVNKSDPSGLEDLPEGTKSQALNPSQIPAAVIESLIRQGKAHFIVWNHLRGKAEISNSTARENEIRQSDLSSDPRPQTVVIPVDGGFAVYLRTASMTDSRFVMGTESRDVYENTFTYSDNYRLILLRQARTIGTDRTALDQALNAVDAMVFSPQQVADAESKYAALQLVLHTVPFGTLADEASEKGITGISGKTVFRTAVDSTIFLFPAAGALKAAGHVTAARVVAGTALAIEVSDSAVSAVEGYQSFSKGEQAAGTAQMLLALAQIVFSARELNEFSKIKPGDFDGFKEEFFKGIPGSSKSNPGPAAVPDEVPSTPPSSTAPDPQFDPSQPAVLPTPDQPKSSMGPLTNDGFGKPYGTPAPARTITDAVRHRAGNRQVLAGGQRWHLPKGTPTSRIPVADAVGDQLQSVASQAAQRWNRSLLTPNEVAAIRQAHADGKHWLGNLLERQARGRWVEGQVRQQFPQLNWSRTGADVVDPATGITYDILSGTKSNMDIHAKRMADVLFRMITF